MKHKFFKLVLNDVVVRIWWAEHLDLILDDEKFDTASGWAKGNKQKLTRAITKRMGNRLKIIRLKDGYTPDPFAGHSEYANFTCDGSICVSLFRHIRNAIAHKHVKLLYDNKMRYYQFRDYSNQGILTADIQLSHDTLSYFCEKYEAFAHQFPTSADQVA